MAPAVTPTSTCPVANPEVSPQASPTVSPRSTPPASTPRSTPSRSPSASPARSPLASPLRRAPRAVALLGVARAGDGVVLAQYEDKVGLRAERAAFEAAAQTLLRRGCAAAQPGLRDREAVLDAFGTDGSGGDCVYLLHDVKGTCLLFAGVRGQRDFPERLAFGLLHELAERLPAAEPADGFAVAGEHSLNHALKLHIKTLMKEYSDPAKAQQVMAVQEQVDSIKGLMHDNVKAILDSHVTTETLQAKSQVMNRSADRFLQRSTAIKRRAEWRNVRVKAVVTVSLAAVAAYCVLPFLSFLQ